MKLIKVFFLIVFILCCELTSAQQRFKIENGSFLIVGKRTQLICGEMHYSCIPHEYWRDRLKRTKAMGLNTISTYVLGNFHKRQLGIFDFKGQADLSHFIKLTQEESLYVLLRPGPYVFAEWDFGGYPYRLLNELGEELSSQTINRRDNILMVQLENEYGSYGDDKIYLSALKNMIQKAGFDIPLLTCDRGGQIEAGHLEGVFPAINGVLGDDILRL